MKKYFVEWLCIVIAPKIPEINSSRGWSKQHDDATAKQIDGR